MRGALWRLCERGGPERNGHGGPEWMGLLGPLPEVLNTLPWPREWVVYYFFRTPSWQRSSARPINWGLMVQNLLYQAAERFPEFLAQRYGGRKRQLDHALSVLNYALWTLQKHGARLALCEAGHIFFSFARRGRVPKFCPLHRAARERDWIREYRRKNGQAPRAR